MTGRIAAAWLLASVTAVTLQEAGPASKTSLHLGCEREGVHFYKVNTLPDVLPLEAGERIAVSYHGRTQLLRDLSQLRGMVRITDGAAALRFVRLRTSLATWHMWPDWPCEVEIVAGSRARALPSFGLPGPGQWLGGHWNKSSSGMDGILSDDVCRAVGFGPSKVGRAPGGFSTLRWVYVEDGPRIRKSIQKVRENVGEDGEYRRATVARIDPRRVPQLFIGRYE